MVPVRHASDPERHRRVSRPRVLDGAWKASASFGRARVIRGRLPVIGLPKFLRHGPPPAYTRGRGAVGGAEPTVAAGAPRRRVLAVLEVVCVWCIRKILDMSVSSLKVV